MERNLQIWTPSTNFPVLAPGSCSPHFGHNVAPSLHAEDPEPVAGAGWAARPQLHFPHCPLRGARGHLCLGAVGLGTLLWQEEDRAWTSLPAVQTHGIQMWLLLGPCILALATLHLAPCLPNTELTVQRAALMTGGFPGTSLWGHGEAQIPCVPLLSQVE